MNDWKEAYITTEHGVIFGADELKDHEWYLIAHKDYATPMKARYHTDGFQHFEYYVRDGREAYIEFAYLVDKKVTHYMKLPKLPWAEEDN